MSTDMHEPTTRTDWRHTPLSRMPKHGPESGATPGKLGGVISGVSHAYDFDVRTTRIAFVVATIILPVLAAVYVVAWILLPDTPSRAQSLHQIFHDRRRMPLLAVLALVVVVGLFGSFGSWFLYRGAPWGFVLIGLGVLLWVSTSERFAMPRSGRRTTTPSPASPSGFAAATTSAAPTTPASGAGFPPPTPEATTPTDMPHITQPVPSTDPYPTPTAMPITAATTTMEHGTMEHGPVPTPPAPSSTPRRRIPIGSIGTGVAVLWFALMGIGNALDWWHVANLWVLVAGLGIVLTSMIVSTIVNRSWVLPILCVPLLWVIVMLCVAQPDINGASGERTVRPSTVAEATTRQHLATGQLTIDLRDVPLGGDAIVVTAEVGMGRLRVLVPDDADLVLHTDTGAGQAQLDGDELSSGLRQETSRTVDSDTTPASGTFDLDLRVGMGQIDVERVTG